MKKRLTALTLVLLLILSLSTGALAAGLGNFQKVNAFKNGQFTDLSGAHWGYDNVKTAYEYGLMKGESDSLFAPDSNLTVAATITMAARLHSIYQTGRESFVQGNPWYQCYVDYAMENGLITGEYANYDAQIQRWEFAQILGRALPDSVLPAVNQVDDGAIPDVASALSFAPDVYRLYRAGILTGSEGGAFAPYSKILRSEAAAIISRMVDSSLRKNFTLTSGSQGAALTAGEVYKKAQNSVFYIEVYDKSGNAFSAGSGVFLSASGVAVTNYHVIEGAQSAKIRTADGSIYQVKGAYEVSPQNDLAILQIQGSGFVPVAQGDSQSVHTGDTVYALGSPLGLESTFSSGIISNPSRLVDGVPYIQITVPISHGSSGGALLNDRGEFIGVTSAGFADGQNLNLALPAHLVSAMRQSGQVTSLAALFPEGGTETVPGYADFPSVPDFGVYFGVYAVASDVDADGGIYLYSRYALPGGVDEADYAYYELLLDWGFIYIGEDVISGALCDLYVSADQQLTVGTFRSLSVAGGSYYSVVVTHT